jgi:hypothetical protein
MAATTASERCHTSDRIPPAAGQSRAASDWGALRVAGICIGVCNYKYMSVLNNAVRDAEQVNKKLNTVPKCRSDIVLDPTTKMDLKKKIRNTLQETRLQAKPPDLLWLYYAGHAIELSNGKVYLVPTDAKLEHVADDCEDECLGLDSVMKLLRDHLDQPARLEKTKEVVFLVVLDSCRKTVEDRSRNPVSFEPPPDSSPRKYTLYFSCSRTTTASDGQSGGHSPFTQALLDPQHGFFAEGVTLYDGIAHVSSSLLGSGIDSQRPISLGPPDSIPRHFCIRPKPAGGTADGGSDGAGGGHQCMKKLTESEAYAYIERQDKPLYHTSVDEQDSSDVDDDGSQILQGLGDAAMQLVKKKVSDAVNSSVWSVDYEIPDQRPAEATLNLLQKSLLDACKIASKWTITKIDNVEEGCIVPEESDNELWKSNFETLDVYLGINYTDEYMLNMTVVKGIYTYCFTYKGNMYKCEGNWPGEIQLPVNKTFVIRNGQVVTVPFGNAELTFTCTLEKRLSAQSVWNWLWGLFKKRKNPRAGTVTSPDDLFPYVNDSDEDDGGDDT